MKERCFLGIDLGAESGRVMAGRWNGRTIRLEELHRFPNGGVSIHGTLRWDVLRLWAEMQRGLGIAGKQYANRIASVGVDTWGVDFVLLSKSGELLGLPYHYRDARTNGMLRRACATVPRREIFAQSGAQFMELNSLYRLMTIQRHSPEALETAKHLLMMPDFFHWCLCGSTVAEFTDATTTQFMNPRTQNWARGLLRRLDIPTHFLPQIVRPGTRLSPLRPEVSKSCSFKAHVVAPPSHDTASAVAAVPVQSKQKSGSWAYISSGTWSLMGVELPHALLTEKVLQRNFTNEGGVDGTYRLLKNIAGLWLLQRCKASVEAQGNTASYDDLVRLGSKASPLRSLIDVDDESLINPPDMPTAILEACRRARQPLPRSTGELVRCVLESLALKYAQVLDWIEELTGQHVEVIHVVGGGSRNSLLNQLTADACDRPVFAGPVEATALGNVLTQARASGELGSLAEVREIVRKSSEISSFEPRRNEVPRWVEALHRLFGN